MMNDLEIGAEAVQKLAAVLDYYEEGCDQHINILREIESWIYVLESHLKDQLYHYEETIDGQHAPF